MQGFNLMDIRQEKANKLALMYLNYVDGTNFTIKEDDTQQQVQMIMEKKKKRNFTRFSISSSISADELKEYCVEDDLGGSDLDDGSCFTVRALRKSIGVQCNLMNENTSKPKESTGNTNSVLQNIPINKENGWASARSVESSSKGPTSKEPDLLIPQKRSIEHPDFMSASDKLMLDNRKKNEQPKKRLGNRGFVSPLVRKDSGDPKPEPVNDDRLKNIDPVMVETIMNEIVSNVTQLRPDIFNGIRGPPKGLLLFGPPGDGEKMVRALFAVARAKQPSVIFVDEIDSLLTQRTDGEQEASRRIKTEFLVQFDGCGTNSEDRILMIGATNRQNRPHEIDEAARRRFRKKLYVPLPEPEARSSIIISLLSKQHHSLDQQDIQEIIAKTPGYSGSDMDGLIREAALGPIRDIVDISSVCVEDVRPITKQDFLDALTQVRASVSDRDLDLYRKFEKEFGSVNRT
ncbi:Fidgetin-like protein 1 [Terramyces sp. JEL0728]|nr:Fidgetin-like protein 1 [Terramyces sp. JEL0728]